MPFRQDHSGGPLRYLNHIGSSRGYSGWLLLFFGFFQEEDSKDVPRYALITGEAVKEIRHHEKNHTVLSTSIGKFYFNQYPHLIGLSMAELSGRLGLSLSGLSQSVKRGKKLV